MSEPRFEGVAINLGGTVFTVPPLGLRGVRTLLPRIQSIEFGSDGLPLEASMEAVIDVIHAAVRRNYPELSREDLYDRLDIYSFPSLVDAVFKRSGFDHVPPASVGGMEGNGSSTAGSLTGTPSTPGSPPPSDGPGSTSTST